MQESKTRKTDSEKIDFSDRNSQIVRVTWIGLLINILLCTFKFIAGYLGKSQAVVADAVHSLSDTVTDAAILIGVRFWDKPPDAEHPHGHKRLEIIVTIGIGLALVVVAVGIAWNALISLRERHDSTPGSIALLAALASIIVKEWLYRWTVAIGKKIKSGPVIANAWHHRSDAFSSIPAFIAVGTAVLFPRFNMVDHIGAIVVSFFILQAGYRITYPSIQQLMDSSAPEEDINNIRRIATETPGVMRVHKIRTRYVASSGIAVDLHVEVDGGMTVCDGHKISGIVKSRLISQGPDVQDVIVHVEPFETTNKPQCAPKE